MRLTDVELEYLSSQQLGRLATVDPTGAPQNNPVSFIYNEKTDTIDVGGEALSRSRKFRNILGNERVALVVDDVVSVEPWQARGVEIRGHAEALIDQIPPVPGFSEEIIRIHPLRVFSWGIDPNVEGMLKRII